MIGSKLKLKNTNPEKVISNYIKNISGNYYDKRRIEFISVCNDYLLKEINNFIKKEPLDLKILFKSNDICIGLIKKSNPFRFFIFKYKENENEIIYNPIGYLEFTGNKVIVRLKFENTKLNSKCKVVN